MIRFVPPLAAVAVLALAGPADAQLVYQFADTSGAPTTSFTATAGQTISLRVYLRDTTGGAPTLSANGGLFSSAVRLSYTNPTVTNIPNLTTGAVPAIPPWIDGTTNSSVANASAVVNVFSSFSAGVLPQGDRVLLGTFTFTANAEGVSSLTAADPNPTVPGDTTYFTGSASLDGNISSAVATLNVNPIPEPAVSLGLVAGVLAVGAAVRRRVAAAR